MKNILLLLGLMGSLHLSASDINPPYTLQINSYECKTVTGMLEIHAEIRFSDSLIITEPPVLSLPDGWKVIKQPKWNTKKADKNYFEDDYNNGKGKGHDKEKCDKQKDKKEKDKKCKEKEYKIKLCYIVTYNTKDIPYYPVSFTLTTPQYTYEGRIYFTPYNTIEIWDSYDYSMLKRVWLIPSMEIPQRVYVDKKDIPVSDIPVDYNPVEEWQDDARLVFIDGLAYAIPMLPTNPDSLSPLELPDTTTLSISKAEGKSNEAKLFSNCGGCSWGRNRFHADITGNVRSLINGKTTDPIPLSGLKVQLYETDGLFERVHGVATTNDNGGFAISINFCKAKPSIKVYVKIFAENTDFGIVGKNGLKKVFVASSPITVNYSCVSITQNPILMGNITESSLSAVSLVVRAWRYTNAFSGIQLEKGLVIRANKNNCFFLPSKVIGQDATVGLFPMYLDIPAYTIHDPTIYLTNSDAQSDETVFHEFGHFVMWQLQDMYWTDIASGSYAVHKSSEESNSRIPWTEGWANAFSLIVDSYYWNMDGESVMIKTNSSGLKEEKNKPYYLVENGFLSESYVSYALYDLWDGPTNLPGFSSTAYDDKKNDWFYGFDDVEFSFKSFCDEIRNGDPSEPYGQIGSIESFFKQFTKGLNCKKIHNVKKVFDNNGINIVNEYAYIPVTHISKMTGGLNSDEIFKTEKINFNESNKSFLPYSYSYIQEYDVNEFPILLPKTGANDYNIIATATNESKILRDNLLFNPGSSFYINNYRPSGFSDNPSNPKPPYNSNLMLTMCDGMKVEIKGSMCVGENSYMPQLFKANVFFNEGSLLDVSGTLTINEESILSIGKNATIILRPGSVLNVKGSLLVGNLGYFCIDKSAVINIEEGGEFYIASNAINGYNHVWFEEFFKLNKLPTCSNDIGNCSITGGNPNVNKRAEALLFDGIDDLVEIPESNGRLNLGTGDFVMEAFIKSNVTNLNHNHQAILSKRTWANPGSPEADGFLFGIWGTTGQLFMQMKGTPNIRNYSSPSVLDGKCHHVAVRRSAGVISFFIDGAPVGNGDFTNNRDISTEGSLRIGYNHVSHLPFNGYVMCVRIWNRALSNNDILYLFNKKFNTLFGLVGNWDMNDLDGSLTVTDLSCDPPSLSCRNDGILGTSYLYPTAEAPQWISECDVLCDAEHNYKSAILSDDFIESAAGNEVSLSEGIEINVYPNPFNNEINITLSGEILEYPVIKMYNSMGMLIAEELMFSDYASISFNNLSAGVYIIIVNGKNITKSFRVVKE